jgi:hypothetical protein
MEKLSMPSLAFIHTVPDLVATFRPLAAAALPNWTSFNIADESLLKNTIRERSLSTKTMQRLSQYVFLATEGGADAIVVTCSSLGGAVDLIRPLSSHGDRSCRARRKNRRTMGEALAFHARKLLRGVDEAVREVSEVAHGHIGHVKIGASPTAADWLLPNVLARSLEEAPNLTFDVKVGLGEVLRRDLKDGRLDFGVAPLVKDDASDFTISSLEADTLVVAVRPGHQLARRRVVIGELSAMRWMIPTVAAQN